ncbi:MAG: DUF554 family protein [Verrucomicrobiae bacterium]|nr:DUF554 family protein [Verrucomicrobiae bacterium]
MVGTWINAGAILLGGCVGLTVRRDPSPRAQWLLKALIAAAALWTGLHLVWSGIGGSPGRVLAQLALALLALVLAGALGRALGFQRQLNALGRYARERFAKVRSSRRPDFSEGLVVTTILCCATPLALVGALLDGLPGDPRALVIKAAIDGLAALALARILGVGTLVAALPLIAFQGSITLGAASLKPWMHHPGLMPGLLAVAGLLVTMTVLVVLDVRKVPLADYLPALLLGPVLRLWLP